MWNIETRSKVIEANSDELELQLLPMQSLHSWGSEREEFFRYFREIEEL